MPTEQRPDVYARSPIAGSPAGWYPMYSGGSLRARAFGTGPAPVMAWWTGEAWDQSDTRVLFDSRRGAHAWVGRVFDFMARAALLAVLIWTVLALDRVNEAWGWTNAGIVLAFGFLVFGGFPRRTTCLISEGYLSAIELGAYGWSDGLWSVRLASIVDIRSTRTAWFWFERGQVHVVLDDGGRLVARRVAGAGSLVEVLGERVALSRGDAAG